MTEFLTAKEVAPILKMSEQGVYRAIRERQFPFQVVKIGKQIRIRRSSLEAVAAPSPASSDAAKK